MIKATRTDEPNVEFRVTKNSLLNPAQINFISSTSPPPWLKRARIISASISILLQLAYLIFIIVCIALYPRCEKASETPWWLNSVFLRFSTGTIKFNNLTQQLEDYKNQFSMQALWLTPVLPLSDRFNPMNWQGVDGNLGTENELTNLIDRAHENDIRILVDYPLNHFSIQSSYFPDHNDSYFVWNDQGNTSNWMTNDYQNSAWNYNNRKNSFYLNQFSNSDSIDINYRNNHVFNDIMNSFSYWNKTFQFDGFNLQGISYAYEDYQFRNETNENNNNSRTRHLEEDYLLLARIRMEIDSKKILLLDSIDSLSASNEQLTRYYGDKNGYLGGVQMASLNSFILNNQSETDLTSLFDRYFNSIFYKQDQPFIWSSVSSNSKLNEAFFAACLFHTGAISINIDRQEQQLTANELDRLRQIITFARTLDVFRVGRIEQNIISNKQWLTIERTRRGSKHHMIIINFSNTDQEHTIELKQGITTAVEVLLTNIENPGSKYETNALIDMTESIHLKSYEYLIIRWSPSIDGLGIIF